MTETFWNGEPTAAIRGTAIVADSPDKPEYWANDLIGMRIDVVQIFLDGGGVSYIDDTDGEGWMKVTVGNGSPRYGHKNVEIEDDSFEPYGEDMETP